MEESTIFELLEDKLLNLWKNEIWQNDNCGFKQAETDIMNQLTAELNEKSKELLNSYSLAMENRMDYFYYNINIKILNLGIKIGMELQKAFSENDK